uniref:NADH-ubiquinone oxidoreductase chain 2 n=1 Tax=Neoeriocheir leptognathus TaxID=215781 RepID=A0A411IFD8_9EUCA|nr:NADH dehydrogenase subunit 2 [Neoeriocheir leptognathus]QBB87145.1 NADH dehydrogenase subunit 2 [Neoeriocheir leptognathus]
MSFPISFFLFFFTLTLGSFISISSSSWFGAWIGLELNLMSFIPLITFKSKSLFSEAALKYFLIQALGSVLFISSGILSLSFYLISSLSILLSLLLKLGSAPFHFWFPQVMEGLQWPQIFILSTIQKLAPLTLISYLMNSSILIKMTILSSILSALIGSLGGLNLTLLRKIIAFSSINHLSWMLMAVSISDMSWLIYFIIYMFIILSITSVFHKLQTFSLSMLIQSDHNSTFHAIIISLNFLSLSGLPPMTGFIPKWIIMQIMLNLNLYIPLFFLLFSALITLYFYLRIIISMIILLNPILNFNMKYKSLTSFSSTLFFKSSFNFIGIIYPLYFIFI